MQAAPIIAAFVSAAGSMYTASETASAQREAAGEQRRMTQLNATAQEAETAEQARRMSGEMAQQEATARARAAASGASIEGTSLSGYLGEIESENLAQLDWLRRSGSSTAALTLAEGESRAKGSEAMADVAMTEGYVGAGTSIWGGISATAQAQG